MPHGCLFLDFSLSFSIHTVVVFVLVNRRESCLREKGERGEREILLYAKYHNTEISEKGNLPSVNLQASVGEQFIKEL